GPAQGENLNLRTKYYVTKTKSLAPPFVPRKSLHVHTSTEKDGRCCGTYLLSKSRQPTNQPSFPLKLYVVIVTYRLRNTPTKTAPESSARGILGGEGWTIQLAQYCDHSCWDALGATSFCFCGDIGGRQPYGKGLVYKMAASLFASSFVLWSLSLACRELLDKCIPKGSEDMS
ncbi:hypothetical protein PoMZ_01912, partial [Pyricularia oryzae]